MAKADEVTVTDSTPKVEEVKEVKATPVIVKEKMVKATPKFSGKRFIGGTTYEFEKDKEIEISADAKRSLSEAGAIYL